MKVNERHVKDVELRLYDDASKALLRQRPNTDAGQDHIATLYANQPSTIRQEGDHAAVVFLHDPNNLLAPWFFHRTDQGWQLDGDVPNLIAYNHLNQWHFKRQDHPYRFAFTDFYLDAHGFAFYRPDQSTASTPKAFLGAMWYAYGYHGRGVLVIGLIPGSAAERAGLEVGDIILSYDGHAIEKPGTLFKLIRADAPGKTVRLEIARGTLQDPITVTLDDGTSQTVRPTTVGLSSPRTLTVPVTLGERPRA